MGFLQNIFYPLSKLFGQNFWGRSNWIMGMQGPVWVDTDKPGEVYYETPQVKLVFDRLFSMYSNMQVFKERKVKSKSGVLWEIVEDEPLRKLLDKPNFSQGFNEFMYKRIQFKIIYGNLFTYKNVVAPILNTYPVSMRNISPVFIQPILTGKFFDQTSMAGVVSEYQYRDRKGIERRFKQEEILWTRIPSLDDDLLGDSALKGYKMPISNINKAYEYLYAISAKRGAIGALTADTGKGEFGSVPVTEKERERLYKKFHEIHGIGEDQASVIISQAAMKWQAFGYPTRELMLIEQIDKNTLVLIDSLRMNSNIFASAANAATYENVRMGYVQTYQDAVQPWADLDMQDLGAFIGLKEDERLRASYEHLDIMKEFKLKGMQSIKILVDTLTASIAAFLMTKEEAMAILRTELGLR